MVNDTEFGINHQPAIEAYRRDVGAPIKSPASIPFARDDGVSLLHMAFKGATFPRYWWSLANVELFGVQPQLMAAVSEHQGNRLRIHFCDHVAAIDGQSRKIDL